VRRFCEVFALSLLACLRLSASPIPVCVSGANLASYEALTAGCYVGPLVVKDFAFSVVSSSPGATAVADSSIYVTVYTPGNTLGLLFSSSDFNVAGGNTIDYLIGFTWDATPDIRNASDILDPGPVDIVTNLCPGSAFTGTSCPEPVLTLEVYQPSQLTASVEFPPTPALGVRDNIMLDGSGGPASFQGIENDVTVVPEPVAAALVAGGLLLWMALGRRRRELSQIVPQSRQ
jgi:hypothetical protein